MKSLRGFVCASMVVLSALVSQLAMAASGTEVHPLYVLAWSNPKEVLTYRSCGCADACWTATVKVKKTGAVKATLKRNCDRLAYALGRRPLQALNMPLELFDSENKNQEIKQTLERVLGR
jgi:hypothetical protein